MTSYILLTILLTSVESVRPFNYLRMFLMSQVMQTESTHLKNQSTVHKTF